MITISIIDETIIIEDSVVGVKAGNNANIKVIGLTAGGHWHENRDEKDLLECRSNCCYK